MTPEIENGPCSDICVLDNDGDPADFCHTSRPKARKPHKCCECRGTIRPGEIYEHAVGKWNGDILTFDTCTLCLEIRDKFSCGGGWVYCGMWETFWDALFPRMTFGCLDGLSPEAKEKMLAAWRKWKGLVA